MRFRLFFLTLIAASNSLAANPKINDGAIYPITCSEYPKTCQKWGKAGVARINALLPKAADKIAALSECDKLDIIDLSDERSVPGKKVIFFADCANGKRFYMSDDELKSDSVIVSKQAKTANLSDNSLMNNCVAQVKAQLNHPSTYKQHLLTQNIYHAPTGNIVTSFEFSAKNSFGLETRNQAKCYTDDQGMGAPEIEEISN